MKKLLYILCFVFVFCCDSENVNDCFQKAGTIIQKEFSVDTFDKILVNRNIELIIKEGLEQKVVIQTGENLLNDIDVTVSNGKLTLTDYNDCNYVREYGITKVYITAPNITEIRSSTQFKISSDGVLSYPNLSLFSENYTMPDSYNNGDFYLTIENESLTLLFNNLSNCFISGKTNDLNISFVSGTSRFEGRHFEAQHITLWNRGSNDMIVNPQQSISGKISGTGDVISVNRPPFVDVQELYKGRLIFE